MNGIKAFFTNNWHTLLAVVAFCVVLYLVYRAGKKEALTPVINSDTGALSQADIDKSNALAQRLRDDIAGLNLGHDDTIYNELIQSSNVIFALTLGKYRQLTGSSLISDLNGEFFGGWDVIDNIIQKANQLNLT